MKERPTSNAGPSLRKNSGHLSGSIRRIFKAYETVLAPAWIIAFRAIGIHLSPTRRDLNTSIRYSPADERLFYAACPSLGQGEIVGRLPSGGCVSLNVEAHCRMISQPLRIALPSTRV